jgi:hypothetical protein
VQSHVESRAQGLISSATDDASLVRAITPDRLIGLPTGSVVSDDGEAEIDVGVIPLPANAMSFFDGCTPIEDAGINASYVVDHAIAKNSIFLIGYSASNSQVRVNHADKTVRQTSFQFAGLAEVEEVYQREGLLSDPLGGRFANIQMEAN